jgi:hypothetical protein
MAFSTQCIHKGCYKNMEPYLDPDNNKIYCSSCDQELTNLTHFVKVQLKANKQYKPKQSKSFAVKCLVCKKEDRPKLVGKEVVCSSCSKPLSQLSEPFKVMLREKLKSADKDVC